MTYLERPEADFTPPSMERCCKCRKVFPRKALANINGNLFCERCGGYDILERIRRAES